MVVRVVGLRRLLQLAFVVVLGVMISELFPSGGRGRGGGEADKAFPTTLSTTIWVVRWRQAMGSSRIPGSFGSSQQETGEDPAEERVEAVPSDDSITGGSAAASREVDFCCCAGDGSGLARASS